MTISDIAYSPAAMFLDGKSISDIQTQSELYTIDKKQMATYCHAFERFFPILIETLRTTQTPHIPKTQWLVLSKSIIYIFTAFLFDYAITHKANPRLINEDREKLHSFTHSQTQGDLLHALSFNKGLHEKLCSASRHLRRGHPLPKADTGSLFHVYNSKNITDYLIRKILKSKVPEIKVSNKPRVVVTHRLFDLCSNPLNPTGLMIIKKKTTKTRFAFQCPISAQPLIPQSGVYFSPKGMLVYPVVDGIPCLLPQNALVATHFADFSYGK